MVTTTVTTFFDRYSRKIASVIRGWLTAHTMPDELLHRKTVSIVAPHNGTMFTVALYPGTGDRALRAAIANRVRLPQTLEDGSESFYLTDGAPDGIVLPLCADGLPDGLTLTLHTHDSHDSLTTRVTVAAPTCAAEPAPVPAPSPASAPATIKDLGADLSYTGLQIKAASVVQARFRGRMARVRVRVLSKAALTTNRSRALYAIIDCTADAVERWKLQRYLPWHLSKYEMVRNLDGDREGDVVYGMEKMSRMSTDLANERTLLAWVRTTLAIMRTSFATIGIEGVNPAWSFVHSCSVGLMVLLMVAAAFVGSYRYYRVARICSLKNIPASFGKNRMPMWPVTATLGTSVATVAVAILARGFA